MSRKIVAVLVGLLWAGATLARADTIVGGPGGTEFAYQCQGGGYLVGLRAYTGSWIDNVQALCAKRDAFTGELSKGIEEGPIFGGNGGSINAGARPGGPAGCPKDHLIFHFIARVTSGQSVLGRIELSCVSSATLERQRPPPHAAVQGDDPLESGPGVNEIAGASCKANQIAVGIRGRAGDYLDAFGLICGPAPVIEHEQITSGMEDGIDRPGSDYSRFALYERAPDQCRKACRAERDRCRAWTYVRPGVQVKSAMCYLKDAEPAPVPNACCISGTVRPIVVRKPSDTYKPGPGGVQP